MVIVYYLLVCCVFVNIGSFLPDQITIIMDKMFYAYREFEHMLLKDRIYEDDCISFRDICKELKVNRSKFNKLLLKELGYTGEQILDLIFS